MTDIHYRELNAQGTLTHLDAIKNAYAEVFTRPPYQETPEQIEQFGGDIIDHSNLPGYRCITAWHGDTLAGFVYAITMGSERWFRRAVAPPPEHLAHVDRCFVLEWGVRPAWRRHGIGSELMRQVLADRPEPYAVLSVIPEAEAKQIYLRAGWIKVGDSQPTAANPRPAMEIMHLPLR